MRVNAHVESDHLEFELIDFFGLPRGRDEPGSGLDFTGFEPHPRCEWRCEDIARGDVETCYLSCLAIDYLAMRPHDDLFCFHLDQTEIDRLRPLEGQVVGFQFPLLRHDKKGYYLHFENVIGNFRLRERRDGVFAEVLGPKIRWIDGGSQNGFLLPAVLSPFVQILNSNPNQVAARLIPPIEAVRSLAAGLVLPQDFSDDAAYPTLEALHNILKSCPLLLSVAHREAMLIDAENDWRAERHGD